MEVLLEIQLDSVLSKLDQEAPQKLGQPQLEVQIQVRVVEAAWANMNNLRLHQGAPNTPLTNLILLLPTASDSDKRKEIPLRILL
jgi:hypothetical protein